MFHLCGERSRLDREDGSRKSGSCQSPGGTTESASQSFLEWGQNNLLPGAETLLLRISEGILGTVGAVIDMLVAFIICLYVLNSKEIFLAQAKKIVLAVCSPGRASQLFEFADICHDTFGGFISGKIIDSIMVGILCFIAMSILGLPFALLISVVVGITDVIPFFGPFIGAVPSGVLLLFIDPWAAVKFALLILILQQIDGNIIAPKILGKTTRLASFWVLFAIIVGGGLFGLPGMILGVPTMAVIYIYFARLINNRLADRNLSTMTEVYENFEKYQINKEDIFGREACASDLKNGGAKELLINTGAEIEENVPMGKYTSFRAGGRAAVVVCAGSEQQLLSVLSAVSNAGVPHTILGNGTNTLFRDSGYQGVVIRLGSGFS